MDKILLVIFIINLIFSVVYSLVVLRKNGQLCYLVIFLTIPVFGFLMYLIPTLMTQKRQEYSYDKESLVKRYKIEKQSSLPDVNKELNLVPIKDAMAISSDEEKRALLLEQLKKDLYTNYKSILLANNDRDSESAHYAATAKMEVNRRMNEELMKVQAQVKEHLDDYSVMSLYMEKLFRYIESGLLSNKEAMIFKKEYCSRFEDIEKDKVEKEYAQMARYYVAYMIDLDEIEQVIAFWDACTEDVRSEKMYMEMLKLFYTLKDRERFYETIDSLSQSEIELSADGLTTLRYWRNRR